MIDQLPDEWRLYLGVDMAEVESLSWGAGEIQVLVRKRPGRTTDNEDAALVAPIDEHRLVLAAADGAGGLPEGAHASSLAMSHLAIALMTEPDDAPLTRRIEIGLSRAHDAIADLRCGAATTANVVLIEGNRLWSYHAGDSTTLVLGGDGAFKLKTVPHSPVGQQVDSGALSEEQAIHHADLHLVSNLLGVGDSYVEPIAPIVLQDDDTVIVATDGLFDNLLCSEVRGRASGRPLHDATVELAREVHKRMTRPDVDDPCKPDDLAMVLYRPQADARRNGDAAAE